MPTEEFLPKTNKPNYENVNPWTIIKQAANAMGIIVNNPNPNCKKCFGRGFTGRYSDTKEPIPCNCIFPKSDRQIGEQTDFKPRNRQERRQRNKHNG